MGHKAARSRYAPWFVFKVWMRPISHARRASVTNGSVLGKASTMLVTAWLMLMGSGSRVMRSRRFCHCLTDTASLAADSDDFKLTS